MTLIDWVHAQSDLSLGCAHRSFCWFRRAVVQIALSDIFPKFKIIVYLTVQYQIAKSLTGKKSAGLTDGGWDSCTLGCDLCGDGALGCSCTLPGGVLVRPGGVLGCSTGGMSMGVASGAFILGVTLAAVLGMLGLDGGWVFLVGAGCFTGSGSGMLAEITYWY